MFILAQAVLETSKDLVQACLVGVCSSFANPWLQNDDDEIQQMNYCHGIV